MTVFLRTYIDIISEQRYASFDVDFTASFFGDFTEEGGFFAFMAHSEKRKGRRVKTSRSTRRNNDLYLPALFEQAYRIKKSEGLADGTLSRYDYAIRLFIDYLHTKNHSLDFAELDNDTCREFASWLLKDKPRFDGHKFKSDSEKTKGVSPRYVNDLIKSIRTLFRVLVEEKTIDTNPFESVKAVKQPEKLINVLTPEELRQLLNVIDKNNYVSFRDYCIITLCIDTMARIGEVLNLTLAEVDLHAKEIVFKETVTKTRRGRIVPIQSRTARLLRELISEVEEFDSEYIFLSNYGEPLTTNHFRHRLKGYAKQAGIRKNVHPHLLRHSAATIYLESGGNLRFLQSILGHVDQRMTSRYTHLSRGSIAENHESYSAMNQVLDKLNRQRKTKRK